MSKRSRSETISPESAILYENGDFWVRAEQFGSGRLKPKSNGYAVYQSGVTHSRRVAIIGFEGEEGLARAIAEADRRAKETL